MLALTTKQYKRHQKTHTSLAGAFFPKRGDAGQLLGLHSFHRRQQRTTKYFPPSTLSFPLVTGSVRPLIQFNFSFCLLFFFLLVQICLVLLAGPTTFIHDSRRTHPSSLPSNMAHASPTAYPTPDAMNNLASDPVDRYGITRTPSPTPSEVRALTTHIIDYKKYGHWRFWAKKEWISKYPS